MERIVLAYSGGPDATAAIRWLAEARGAEVVTLTVDLGQGGDLNGVRERALNAGAINAHVLDTREEFVSSFVLPALQAGAVGEDGLARPVVLSRPLLAKKLVDIARIESAAAVACLCTSGSGDQSRFDACVRALAPSIGIVATGHPLGEARSPAADTNLWGRYVDGIVLEDPWGELPAGVYTLTADPSSCPDQPAHLEIAFRRGVPVALNGVAMGALELIDSVSTIAGDHGVGRVDAIDNRPDGLKVRVIGEAPAATVLRAAHRELQRLAIPADLERVAGELGRRYADLIDTGHWFSPLRTAIDAFVADVQQRVTGTIHLSVFKGACRLVGRRLAALGDDASPSGEAR